MKIFFVLIILFVSTNIQAQDQNLLEEYEVAGLGTIFTKLLGNLAKKGTDDVIDVLPKPKSFSDDLNPKNFGDDVIINTSRKSNKFPTGQIDEFGININPIAIRITVRELYEKEYESFQEMSKWDCPKFKCFTKRWDLRRRNSTSFTSQVRTAKVAYVSK